MAMVPVRTGPLPRLPPSRAVTRPTATSLAEDTGRIILQHPKTTPNLCADDTRTFHAMSRDLRVYLLKHLCHLCAILLRTCLHRLVLPRKARIPRKSQLSHASLPLSRYGDHHPTMSQVLLRKCWNYQPIANYRTYPSAGADRDPSIDHTTKPVSRDTIRAGHIDRASRLL